MKEAVTKIAFSFYPEDLELLEMIAKDTGMKKTEVMRQLIKKCANDEKEREIITKASFWEKIRKRKIATSYNVGYEKKEASDLTEASGVSSNTYQNTTKNVPEEKEETLDELLAQL